MCNIPTQNNGEDSVLKDTDIVMSLTYVVPFELDEVFDQVGVEDV